MFNETKYELIVIFNIYYLLFLLIFSYFFIIVLQIEFMKR